MEFTIVGTGPEDEAELLSLVRWLRQDPELTGTATVKLVEGEQPPGTMGGVLEAVHVIAGDVVTVAGLAVSVATWLSSRTKQRSRTIRLDGQDRVLPPDATVDDVRALLRELHENGEDAR
ncbi:effector-associated constant component EACC1 [Streptomyces sp. URMC 129]|uniref:effector-associated constant component EACC1 n=1 Tax=Streptomyces sp. URMC 129 TaxID=3423407 RepID=UPI003F1BDCFE